MGVALMLSGVDFSGFGKPQVTPVRIIPLEAIAIVGLDKVDNDINMEKYSTSLTPKMATYRGIQWSIVSGSEYARINPTTGQVTAKYDPANVDPSNPNLTNFGNVTIKATSSKYPISATKDIQVRCHIVDGAISVTTSNWLPQNGQSFTLTGFMDGHGTTPFIAWRKADDLEGVNYSLHDNEDGTCTVTVLNDEIKKVKIEAYNSMISTTKTQFDIWLNNLVIIDATVSASDAALMSVLSTKNISDSNYNTDPANLLYAGEAAVVTNMQSWFSGNTEISNFDAYRYFIKHNQGTSTLHAGWKTFSSSKLDSIIVPDGALTLGHTTFANIYTGLHIEIPSSIQSIGVSCFDDTKLKNTIILPKSLTSLESMAFRSWNKSFGDIKKFIIEDGGTSALVIGDHLLSRRQGLTLIDLPSNTASIGLNPLWLCNLSNITLICRAATPPTLGQAFYNGGQIKEIYVPAASIPDYQAAANWSGQTHFLPLEGSPYETQDLSEFGGKFGSFD